MFDPNSTFLFILAGLVIIFVIAQSVFFLVRAYKRGKSLGMDMKQIRKTIISTAVFTFAPAVSILLGVITLSKFLGLPLPWLRLSVIGAITYELPAATTTANALGITALSETITNPEVYTAIAWVMTLGIFPGLIWVPIFIKKIKVFRQLHPQRTQRIPYNLIFIRREQEQIARLSSHSLDKRRHLFFCHELRKG